MYREEDSFLAFLALFHHKVLERSGSADVDLVTEQKANSPQMFGILMNLDFCPATCAADVDDTWLSASSFCLKETKSNPTCLMMCVIYHEG